MSEALTIPGVEVGVWQVRNRFDQAAAALADRHYSREKKSNQVGGPGYVLILVTPCERAAWVSKRHDPATTSPRALADGFIHSYRCGLFRNEGAGLASELITAAVALTEDLWGPPAEGWVTYVEPGQIASANPGYCFKQAGWTLDREFNHDRLVRLTLR